MRQFADLLKKNNRAAWIRQNAKIVWVQLVKFEYILNSLVLIVHQIFLGLGLVDKIEKHQFGLWEIFIGQFSLFSD